MAFTDLATLPAESQAAINYLAAAEIVKGVGDNKYNPAGTVTREQMALYLHRTLNWAALAADEHLDSSVLLFTMSGAGGSGWWRAPRVIATNQHVPLGIHSDNNGTTTIEYRDLLCAANGGLVRADTKTEQALHVVWDKLDKRDIAYLIVSLELWERYLAKREAAGLPREPRYINPADGREPIHGEQVMTCGCPLVRYDFSLDTGVISKLHIERGTDDDPILYASTSAAINPGNSGGICLSVDRKFLGIPSVKPYYGNPLSGGYVPADNIGEILTAQEIVKWEKRGGQQVVFRTLGVTVE